MMTPIVAMNPFGDTDQQQLELAYQAMVLEAFTTDEMAVAGAYRPSETFPEPDLDVKEGIHPMLARDKWDQAMFSRYDNANGPVTIPAGSAQENPVLRYNIGDKQGDFNVSTNDELWAVMQPSLRLVTKIMRMHPVWNALLNIYHLKPLPWSADSRTAEQRAKDNDIQRSTFWYALLPRNCHERGAWLTLPCAGSPSRSQMICTQEQGKFTAVDFKG